MSKLSLEEIQLEFPLIENELSKRVLGGSGYGDYDPERDSNRDGIMDDDSLLPPNEVETPPGEFDGLPPTEDRDYVDAPDSYDEPIENPDPDDELADMDYSDDDSDDRGDEEDDYGDDEQDQDYEDDYDQENQDDQDHEDDSDREDDRDYHTLRDGDSRTFGKLNKDFTLSDSVGIRTSAETYGSLSLNDNVLSISACVNSAEKFLNLSYECKVVLRENGDVVNETLLNKNKEHDFDVIYDSKDTLIGAANIDIPDTNGELTLDIVISYEYDSGAGYSLGEMYNDSFKIEL